MKYKILVVDDDQKTVDLIRLSLEKEQFEALGAHEGLEALTLARNASPDLIILDWMLPNLSGLDLCRIVRAESTIPVIMLTARSTEDDKLLGLNLGIDDYLTKPFSLRELVARVRVVLRRTYQSEERSSLLRFRDLVIDLQDHEVWLCGKSIQFTPREFKLLEMFARFPGRTFSRQELVERVCGPNYDGFDRTIDFHLGNLRKKSRSILHNPRISRQCIALATSSGGLGMWNSLRLRLILMFMLVVMVAVGTVAFFASQATTDGLYIYNQAQDNRQVVSTMLTAYQQHQSQKKLQTLAEQLARSSHQRIILFDHQMRVIADSERKLIGQILAKQTNASNTVYNDPGGVSGFSISTGSSSPPTTIGASPSSLHSLPLYISTDFASQPPDISVLKFTTDSPEAHFLASVHQSLWLAILIAGLTALLLALVFANTLLKPLHTLKAVAERMEQGDLNQRASIKASGEIGALAHAFNAMADSLSRSERLRRNLVSDVAHELRNPLMNIRGYLELFQDQVLEPTSETISSLYEETSLLSRLVADLQDLSLAEAGQLRLALRPISLEEVAHQAVQIVQPHLARKDLALHVHIPPDLPAIEADQERIAQVLRNLLSNAITHTPRAGEICLSASASAGLVHISVQDTGSGIAPEHLPNLFERFYRADSSRARATGGTGLGLAIVKQIVQAHGGQVTVESQPGKGTCFTFSLPGAADAVGRKPLTRVALP